MVNLLFVRVLFVICGMLCLSAIAVRLNQAFTSLKEFLIAALITSVLYYTTDSFSSYYPLNFFLLSVFAFTLGWVTGPFIEFFAYIYKAKRYYSDRGLPLRKKLSPAQKRQLTTKLNINEYHKDWQNLIFLIAAGIAIAVLLMAFSVYYTNLSFNYFAAIVHISIYTFISMFVINLSIYKAKWSNVIKGYLGAIFFIHVLLKDFQDYENIDDNYSWQSAIEFSVGAFSNLITLSYDIIFAIFGH